MITANQIAKILAPAIDARVPYAKVMIGMIQKLVTDEREACAKIADGVRELYATSNGDGDPTAAQISGDIALTIRNRETRPDIKKD